MKACFYIGPSKNEWFFKYFPGRSPGELQIVGKSYLRHAIDLCSQLKTTDIYIADCFFRPEQQIRLGDGQFWSLRLHRLPGRPCLTPDDLLRREPQIADGDDLLIFWGLTLPDVPDVQALLEDLRPVEKMPDVLPDGIWLLRDGKLFECACPLFKLDSLKNYFDLNFRLLNDPGVFNLPGYSSGSGSSVGMDVIIMLDCELERPVLIQDNVCLERGVRLQNGVIIGKDVLVDENSELDHCIVSDHVYIGRNMYFHNKIVDGSRVIDVGSGVYADLEDDFLASSTPQYSLNRIRLAEWLIALGLVILLAGPYLLPRIFRRSLAKLSFFEFVQRIYPKCCLVLWHRASLVRNGENDQVYAFRFSDVWPHHRDEHLKELDDMYFRHHRTVSRIFGVVFWSLLKRFLMLNPPDRRSNKRGERPPAS